jgi:alpha 1,3-glucosidase
VKHENFKKCAQSGFCKRNRALADDVSAKGSSFSSPYELDATDLHFENGQLTATILKTVGPDQKVKLPILISFLDSGVARVTVDEAKRMTGDIEIRHESQARKERYNDAESWVIVGGMDLSKSATLSSEAQDGYTTVLYGPDNAYQAVIRHAPFSVEFQRDGQTHVQFNNKGYLNMEHWRRKVEAVEGEQEVLGTQEDESTWWEETFGGNTDTKPRGPESVGLDITFSGYNHVFGIPEHADSMSLRGTR